MRKIYFLFTVDNEVLRPFMEMIIQNKIINFVSQEISDEQYRQILRVVQAAHQKYGYQFKTPAMDLIVTQQRPGIKLSDLKERLEQETPFERLIKHREDL